MQASSLETGGRAVHFLRGGHGEPLLYLHHMAGLAGSAPALARLAASFDVVAPHAPGWGPAKDDLSVTEPGPLDITLHQLDVLDALGLDAVHVAGIGIGAWMAAELAAIAPQRVRRLVLVNPLGLWLPDAVGADPFAQHPGKPSEILFSRPELRAERLLAGRDRIDALVEELLNLRAAAKFLWPMLDTGVQRRLGRIRAPSLVVTSEHDAIVPAAHGDAWQRGIRGARLARLERCGHLAEIEQPDALVALIEDFVEGEHLALA